MNTSLKMAGLLASIALFAGCAAPVDPTSDTEAPVAQDQQELVKALPNGGIQIRTGACQRDGMVIKDGVVYRLGVAVGTDVTGISTTLRRADSGACHNTAVWQAAANYICNMNHGGTRNVPVASFDEYIDDGVLVHHPGGEVHDGLYFAYVDVQGPCDTPSQLDFALDQIECCKTAPTPTP